MDEKWIFAKVAAGKKGVMDFDNEQFGKVFIIYAKNPTEMLQVVEKTRELASKWYRWQYPGENNNLYYENSIGWTNNILWYGMTSHNGAELSYSQRNEYMKKYKWQWSLDVFIE